MSGGLRLDIAKKWLEAEPDEDIRVELQQLIYGSNE